jgi:hypothetical protein
MVGRGPSPFEATTLLPAEVFSLNDETRFPPSGRGLEGNGPVSLRVELDTGGSAFPARLTADQVWPRPIGCF